VDVSGDLTLVVVTRSARGRGNAALVLIASLLTLVVSAGICAGAVLAPAPAAAVPLVVAMCVGLPLFAAWEVPTALVCLRAARADRAGSRALDKLRRTLEELPETEHPLGL
jgi:hypothetical protein